MNWTDVLAKPYIQKIGYQKGSSKLGITSVRIFCTDLLVFFQFCHSFFSLGLARQYTLNWGYIYLMGNCSDIYGDRFFKGMECAGEYELDISDTYSDSNT